MENSVLEENVVNSKSLFDNTDKVLENEYYDANANQSGKVSNTKSALICYGNGAELGDFSLFAKYLKKNLTNKYLDSNIKILRTYNRNELVDEIANCGLSEIAEFHIFSHAIGAGLFLGYHDSTYSTQRSTFLSSNSAPTYEEVVDNEIGSLLTDHLITTYALSQPVIKSVFTNLEFAKLWGCNSGVSNWIYDGTDPYWGALNTKNNPKPSIAQCLSTFIDKPVYGATSGSHIEYKIGGKWISGYDYKRKFKKTYPNKYEDIRLHPDRGDYVEYTP